ncbi:MAG: hypothetical protein WC838_07855, partial [Candidatus Margulisiibacteriota bacterium]
MLLRSKIVSGLEQNHTRTQPQAKSLSSSPLSRPYELEEIVEGIFLRWEEDYHYNAEERLAETVLAFVNPTDVSKNDSVEHKAQRLVKANNILISMWTGYVEGKIKLDNEFEPQRKAEFKERVQTWERFLEFSKEPIEITSETRYIPILKVMVDYLNKRAELSSALTKGNTTSRPSTLSILEVGGAPQRVESGAIAIRYLVRKLRKMFPEINIQVVITDVNFPKEYNVNKPGDYYIDPDFVNFAYVYDDLSKKELNER